MFLHRTCSWHRPLHVFTPWCLICHWLSKKVSLQKKMSLNSIFKGCHFVKGFRPILRVANNSQKKFTLHVPDIGILCYLDSDEILL